MPAPEEFDILRKVLNLPATADLIISQNAHSKGISKLLGEQLRENRAASRLLLNQAARELGVSVASFGQWESNRAFPSACYHPRIVAFLGFNPFPN